MSTTLTTQQLVAKLQRKFPLGISSTDAMDFLNEAFRRVNQMSKGGFAWQLKGSTINIPAGPAVPTTLPNDYDPGKKAIIWGISGTPTKTEIPYKSYAEIVNEQHYPAQQLAAFSAWTQVPQFTLSAPTSYQWLISLYPADAFPLANPAVLGLVYHAVSFPPFPVSATVYFPTPDQFDSFICDLAEAELARVYNRSGWDKLEARAMQGLSEMVDSYRTDKLDLASLGDQVMTAQEKQVERSR